MDNKQKIEDAEEAIRNASHRRQLLDELFDEMGVSQNVGEALFDHSPSADMSKQAEQELLGLVRMQQQSELKPLEAGRRKRRPAMMRGMMI